MDMMFSRHIFYDLNKSEMINDRKTSPSQEDSVTNSKWQIDIFRKRKHETFTYKISWKTVRLSERILVFSWFLIKFSWVYFIRLQRITSLKDLLRNGDIFRVLVYDSCWNLNIDDKSSNKPFTRSLFCLEDSNMETKPGWVDLIMKFYYVEKSFKQRILTLWTIVLMKIKINCST